MDVEFVGPPLTPVERRLMLPMRRWRFDERRVVYRGLLGRFAIAIEPALIAVLFAVFAVWIGMHGRSDATHDDKIFAIIFAPGALAFAVYAWVLMIAPTRAALQTLGPIFIVDGYLRTRGRDDFSSLGTSGYVAVLTDDRRVAAEWTTRGDEDLPHLVRPALLEFSEYGGIHTIDGKKTGILPEDFPVLGIGGNTPPRRVPPNLN